jgi:hypothetical protein
MTAQVAEAVFGWCVVGEATAMTTPAEHPGTPE